MINIDDGAIRAVKNKKSLLPSGIKSIEGTFEAGEVIWLNDKAKAVTNFSSAEFETLAGKHSTEIRKLLRPQTQGRRGDTGRYCVSWITDLLPQRHKDTVK